MSKQSDTVKNAVALVDDVEAEAKYKIRLFFQDSRMNLVSGLPAWVILTGMLYYFSVDNLVEVATWSVLTIVMVLFAVLVPAPLYQDDIQTHQKRLNIRLFWGLMIGLCYGVSIFLFPEPMSNEVFLVTVFILFIASIFVCVSYVILPIYFIAFAILAMTPLVIYLLLDGRLFFLRLGVNFVDIVVHAIFLAQFFMILRTIKISESVNERIAMQFRLEQQLSHPNE